jgi:hypothetical protein
MGDYHDKDISYKVPDLLILILIHRIPMIIMMIMITIEGILIMEILIIIILMMIMIGIDSKDMRSNP